MEREAITLSKSLSPSIIKHFSDLLKLAGSLLLLSQKVERDQLYSNQVRAIINDIAEIVNTAKISVHEIALNSSYYKKFNSVLEGLEKIDIYDSPSFWKNDFRTLLEEFKILLSKIIILLYFN